MNLREKMMSCSRNIRDEKGLILLTTETRGGSLPSKSALQTRTAQRFRPMQSLKVILAVLVHQSTLKKAMAYSRYQRIMGRAC